MSKKEQFIKLVKTLMERENFTDGAGEWNDALDYWNALQMAEDKEKVKFTENGKLVLLYMQENRNLFNNLFKAKEVGEGMSLSSRTVSGAMRKLVNDGFVEKMSETPVVYSLTELGINTNPNAE